MTIRSLTTISALSLLFSCNEPKNELQSVDTFVSPSVRATYYDINLVGALQIYPMSIGTSIYRGNYYGAPLVLSDMQGNYVVDAGVATRANPAIKLAADSYTMLSWGVVRDTAAADTAAADQSASDYPKVRVGDDLAHKNISLRLRPDDSGTYFPVPDYLFHTQNVELDNQTLVVPIRRVVAQFALVVIGAWGAPLNDNIVRISAHVDGVARALNFFTAEPASGTATVSFPLTIAPSGRVAVNDKTMLFPSNSNSTLTIIVDLVDGSQKRAAIALNNRLWANRRLKVVVNLNTSSTLPTQLHVSQWIEGSEVID